MSPNVAPSRVGVVLGPTRYQRHRPEQTLLYHIIEQHSPTYTAHLTAQGRELSGYVQREFDDYLKCGRLEKEYRGQSFGQALHFQVPSEV